MRDHDDNVVIICSIENIDAMGVHTGDSITVAPAQTLTDKEYQRMRDAALAIIRAIGVETGGSNIQFAVNPDNGELVVVEMNPRVSRSSALASKATGFPIAKIAAKLAVGYTLWELPNDITGETVACFEPTIDYVVTKIPRWTFEKFPEADETLTTQMKSVGEAMSIGRTFKEPAKGHPLHGGQALRLRARRERQVARASGQRQWPLETTADAGALNPGRNGQPSSGPSTTKLNRKLSVPLPGPAVLRPLRLQDGLVHRGGAREDAHRPVVPRSAPAARRVRGHACGLRRSSRTCPARCCSRPSRWATATPSSPTSTSARSQRDHPPVREHRKALGITPVYKLVDTCAAEFEAVTPYYYSTYEAPSGESGQWPVAVTSEDPQRDASRAPHWSLATGHFTTTKSASPTRRRS